MAYQHILVPVDGSQISFSAVKQAAEIAKVFGSQLTLISLVAEDPLKDADFYYTSPIMKDYFIQAYNSCYALWQFIVNNSLYVFKLIIYFNMVLARLKP